ncbi:RusA family crossover junction endodeoxyribonuclease [Escherichia coli]|nr:hypothetical protein [Escherichia coli]EFO4455097.1 RusA family crossover junction endodeoxyribonuclease [Escherichia coli]EFO4501509.1 RusA family crossover junction endodeoxyribonuclease [Escherichia coli]
MPSQYSFLTQQEMLCAYRLPFIIYLLSQPLCFQGISDNRKAGKYPASLCNGVDESDRAYPDIIVRMLHRHCSPNTKPISASASSIFSMNSGTISSKLAMYFSSRSEGQAYRDNVARIIKNAMLDIGLAIPVKIRIECHMPDRRRRDLDNLQKAAFDALTKAGFWLDDAQVVDYRVVKMPVTKGGRLELTITEMGNE